MKARDLWFASVITGVAVAVLIAVLGIWGIISGITALKIFYTIAMLGLGAAFIKNLLGGPLNAWRT